MNLNQNFTDLDGKNESWFLDKNLKFLTVVSWPLFWVLTHWTVLALPVELILLNCLRSWLLFKIVIKITSNNFRHLSKDSFTTINFISVAGRTHAIESFEIVIIIQRCDKNHIDFLLKRAPQNMVNCRFRCHLLLEMHDFKTILLVSSRLLEDCQF